MLKLHGSRNSPFVRKVCIVLSLADAWDKTELIPAKTDMIGDGAATAPLNPLGKIPTLERPDGPALYDSRVICRYLDAQFGLGLYPESRLWETLTLEAMGDGIAEAAWNMTNERRNHEGDKVSIPYIEGQWKKVARAMSMLEDRWLPHLAGAFDMGQLAVTCGIGYADFRHGERDWRTAHPALAEWEARVAAIPAVAANQHPTG